MSMQIKLPFLALINFERKLSIIFQPRHIDVDPLSF